jgi:hypothetical protein
MKVKASDMCVDPTMEFVLVKQVMASRLQRRSFNYSPELTEHVKLCKKCREMLPIYLDLMQNSIDGIEDRACTILTAARLRL